MCFLFFLLCHPQLHPSSLTLWSSGIGLVSYTAVTIISRLCPLASPLKPTYDISVCISSPLNLAKFFDTNIVTDEHELNFVLSVSYSRMPKKSSWMSNFCVGFFLWTFFQVYFVHVIVREEFNLRRMGSACSSNDYYAGEFHVFGEWYSQ